MRVLVTGAGGQVGREVVAALSAAGHQVIACDHAALDVADRDAVLQMLGAAQPETVVHSAAWTDVDGCQSDPDRAFVVNALGTRHIVEGCRMVGARVTYLSTDYVFDGQARRPYTEWDTPNPLSTYGRSKLGGEIELGPGDAVVRTSWVCGRHGRNFVKSVLGRADRGEPLAVVDDQHGCPTFADDLAVAICRLVQERRPGVFHVTNQTATTWYDFARTALAFAGYDPDVVKPISTVDLDPPRPAPRPAYAVLDNAALRLSGLPLLPDHRESLKRLVEWVVTSRETTG